MDHILNSIGLHGRNSRRESNGCPPKGMGNNTNRIASAQVFFYRMINRMVEFEECLQANNSKTVELYFTVNQLLI